MFLACIYNRGLSTTLRIPEGVLKANSGYIAFAVKSTHEGNRDSQS